MIVQGEGNGHLTQALSMAQQLHDHGHSVQAVLIGSDNGERIPALFQQDVPAPVIPFKSPALRYSRSGRLDAPATVTRFLRNLPDYYRSAHTLHTVVRSSRPDLILNFYDLCGGLYKWLFRDTVPMVCIAHQYLFLHPDFRFPSHQPRLSRFILNTLSRGTAYGASAVQALSFLDPGYGPHPVTVAPPLLRKQVLDLQPETGDHLLVYLTQPRLRNAIIRWHRQHPEIRIRCFCNDPHLDDTDSHSDTLTWHRPDPSTFLESLRTCKALVTTAGFETVCEAMYLGKPILMVPVPNHLEQQCNAADARNHRLGISHDHFDLSALLDYLPFHHSRAGEAREWVRSAPSHFMASLEQIITPIPPGPSLLSKKNSPSFQPIQPAATLIE